MWTNLTHFDPLQTVQKEQMLKCTSPQTVRHFTPKLHKQLLILAFRNITASLRHDRRRSSKNVHGTHEEFRPVPHFLWKEECARIDIAAKKCWMTSAGEEIPEMTAHMHNIVKQAVQSVENHFKTFDLVATYASIAVTSPTDGMKDLKLYVY